jgi:fructosamine-3-kinase
MTDWQRIADDIGETTGELFVAETPRSLGGGCINTAVKLCDGARCYFVKINDATRIAMFEAERDGLAEMASAQAVRVPRAVLTGSDGRESWIVMEYVAMGRPASGSQVEAGRQLAAMHRQVADAFGWHRDNTIGSTPQVNDWMDDWIGFWRVHRLGFQLELAASHGHGGRLTDLGNRVLEALPALLVHGPEPSLLHGDLWGGNIGYDGDGHPVLFDPAVYFGDREADLAMTELFGGFSGDFYAAYNDVWPIDPGYKVRKTLYNLYHILNHLNLFGGGYAGQATGMMERILVEI